MLTKIFKWQLLEMLFCLFDKIFKEFIIENTLIKI